MSQRRIVVNPDEPNAGTFAYTLYNDTHPVHGNKSIQDYWRRQLRGLRGEDVTVVIHGSRMDEDGNERRFRVTRHFKLNKYSDVFGPGSAFASAIHAVRERHSDESLFVHSFEITTD